MPRSSKTPAEGSTADRPDTVRLSGEQQVQPAKGFPDDKKNQPDVWRSFFASNTPSVALVEQHATYLVDQKQHEHLIGYLNAAIIEGQSQPWMYEVLAVTMEIAKRPPEEVERVVLSMADFGNASYESMMYSGAYLSNLGRDAAALRMYRQAAQLSPERPEPYAVSMKLAARTGVPEDAVWVACGVLRYSWGSDFKQQHKQAENLLAEAEKQLRKSNDVEQLAQLEREADDARQVDLSVRLVWSGTGDLDLSVEDPSGGIATFETRDSVGGGSLLNDGTGSSPDNCYEEYVCHRGFAGEYVLKVTKAADKIVGNRAVLTVITHAGSSSEKKITKTVVLNGTNEFVLRIKLEEGRREQRRTAGFMAPKGVAQEWEHAAAQVGRPTRRVIDREARQAVAEMRRSRQQLSSPAGAIQQTGGTFGGVGLAPVVNLIPEGSSLAVQAVVSPDRRYVRMAISPAFSQIIDVAVFSFQGGTGNTSVPGR